MTKQRPSDKVVGFTLPLDLGFGLWVVGCGPWAAGFPGLGLGDKRVSAQIELITPNREVGGVMGEVDNGGSSKMEETQHGGWP